jgi:hypothetical protein
MAIQAGGFGTRIFFLPNQGATVVASQILKGSGYATINVKGAHYSSTGNLWQQIFGGNDTVTLSTQIDYMQGSTTITSSSIEETRQISVGHPYYFDSGRLIANMLPTDCESIGMTITISAVKNDNLSGALAILNSGELQSTLSLAPPAVSSAVSIAGIVKKLLTNTDPQNSLQGHYDGKVSVAASTDPIRDYCLTQGTLILVYRESDNDTSLDDLDPTQFTTDGDGLKYAGAAMQNTYVMFQISFDQTRGPIANSAWSTMFTTADSSLLAVLGAANDADKQKLWTAAFAMYQQAVVLLEADAELTSLEKLGIAALQLTTLKKAYTDNGGTFTAPLVEKLPDAKLPTLTLNNLDSITKSYTQRLALSRRSLPGGRLKAIVEPGE